jgi:hypothetical protein
MEMVCSPKTKTDMPKFVLGATPNLPILLTFLKNLSLTKICHKNYHGVPGKKSKRTLQKFTEVSFVSGTRNVSCLPL